MEKKRCRSDEEDLDTTTLLNNSSSSLSSKFGCFILHSVFAPVITRNRKHLSEHSLLMLSSASDPDDPEKYLKCLSRSRARSVTDSLSSITTGSDDDDDERLVLKVKNLGFPLPYKFNMHDKEVVGSCNGLVCLQNKRIYPDKPHEVSLWNPATGQFRILPPSIAADEEDFNSHHHPIAVFGFDFKTKDYKVVLFTGLYPEDWNGNGPEDCFCRVQIYSLSTDSWRLLEGIPCLPGFPYLFDNNVVYLNGGGGTFLFLARFLRIHHQQPCLPRNDRFIISFDLTKEIITPIQLPDHDRKQVLLLCNFADKVALFTSPRIFPYTPRIRTHEDFNIWVLDYDEHGSSSSSSSSSSRWTKLHSFRIQLDQTPGFWYKPIGISNDGKYAFLESPVEIGSSSKMNLYNFATEKVKKDFLPCRAVISKSVYAYKPSQVSVSSRSSSSNLQISDSGSSSSSNL